MSFWTTLEDAATGLPADISTVLGVSTGVYVGRRPKSVKDPPLEVIIIRGSVSENKTGFRILRSYSFEIRIRVTRSPGGKVAGELQTDAADAAARTLCERYNGNSRVATLRTAGLHGMTCVERFVDEEPEDIGVLEAVLDLTCLVKE